MGGDAVMCGEQMAVSTRVVLVDLLGDEMRLVNGGRLSEWAA